MLISVIIPVLNGERYIERCINSVLNQTYNNIEVIVVDNGSSDNTLNIIKKMATKEPKIKYFSLKKHGVSIARNFGIKNSQGDYIMFLDCDDTLDKDTINNMLQVAKNNYEIVKCGYKLIRKNKSEFCGIKEKEYEINEDFWNDFFSSYNFNQVWGQLIKKSICEKISFNEDIAMAEDYLFNYYLYNEVQSIYVLDNKYYNYFYNEAGINYSKDINKLIKKVTDIRKVCEELCKKNPKYAVLIENRFLYEIFSQIREIFLNENFKISQLDFLFKNEFYIDSLKNLKIDLTNKKFLFVFLLKKKKYKLLHIIFRIYDWFEGWKR